MRGDEKWSNDEKYLPKIASCNDPDNEKQSVQDSSEKEAVAVTPLSPRG